MIARSTFESRDTKKLFGPLLPECRCQKKYSKLVSLANKNSWNQITISAQNFFLSPCTKFFFSYLGYYGTSEKTSEEDLKSPTLSSSSSGYSSASSNLYSPLAEVLKCYDCLVFSRIIFSYLLVDNFEFFDG